MKHTDLPLIPGPDLVELFQSNNHLDPDGKVGPKTMAKIWAPEGASIVYLCRRRVAYDAWTPEAFGAEFGLSPANWAMLARHISSRGKTGPGFLSTQDGITLGFRRYAASKLREVLIDSAGELDNHFGAIEAQLFDSICDQPTNGWPLNHPGLRAGFIALAADEDWHNWQNAVFCNDVYHDVLNRFAWRTGRMICLAVRARNSAPSFLRGLPSGESEAYEELKTRYIEKRSSGRSRVAAIEREIERGEVWR